MINLDLKLKIKSNKSPRNRSKLRSKNIDSFWRPIFQQAIGGLISGIPLILLGRWLGFLFKPR